LGASVDCRPFLRTLKRLVAPKEARAAGLLGKLDLERTERVRPGGLVIRHDRFADVNPFERVLARDVTAGNTITRVIVVIIGGPSAEVNRRGPARDEAAPD
jgi:hypothetical protein